jgi:signal transduction histidine kinase
MNSPKQPYVPTLRHILRAGTLIFTTLSLLTAAALIIYPKELRVEVDNIQKVNEGLQASNLLALNLLKFGRQSESLTLNRKQEDHENQVRTEAQILEQIQRLKQSVSTDEERRFANQIEGNSRQFLSLRKEIEKKMRPSSPDFFLTNSAELGLILDDITLLNEFSLNLAKKTAIRAARIDRLTDALGGVLMVIFFLGFGVVIFLRRTYLYLPLSNIKNTLVRFSQGERSIRINPQGARELREIGRVYNEMADDLKEHERRRFEFMGGVVHDLRNPLSAMKMASEMLTLESAKWPDAKARDIMQLLDRQIGRINRMISDLMDATRIQAGQLDLKFREHDLRNLIENCVELWRYTSSKHEIVMTLPKEPLIVNCDSGRLEQVLNNLISNAIKYSPGGGAVLISASRDVSGKVNITVTDHGIGVSTSEAGHIFRPFHRSPIASAEKIPGVGLGLSVSKKIVEAHGGKISVESTIGLGSTFRIQLTAAAAKAA